MQSVLMLAVIFLMVKFAWKPIVSALDEREEGIKNALEAAEKAKQEMESISSSFLFIHRCKFNCNGLKCLWSEK